MSRFRILRIDHYDPESVGKKNRILFTIYAVIPTLFFLLINIARELGFSSDIGIILLALLMSGIYILLIRKLRAAINKIKSIGELEVTQSLFRKKIGDSICEYYFDLIKEVSLIKHIPATRPKESKSRYFSYIIKIAFLDGTEESIIVADRSVDLNQKISLAETMKTLRKLVPFNVRIEI
jgi:hypothetical protein